MLNYHKVIFSFRLVYWHLTNIGAGNPNSEKQWPWQWVIQGKKSAAAFYLLFLIYYVDFITKTLGLDMFKYQIQVASMDRKGVEKANLQTVDVWF